ncbi:MAG: ATP synthase F1 subunit gamma [Bacteroidales bacterium]|jgi:F-type H+-transporting ATPase subunit gamma|nr:ATP synthase F1 subunit gamma [Bacteroidales bacterium]
MPNLKEIRTRITSVESTQKITSAMKLVSASKLRSAQKKISFLKPFSNKLNSIIENLSCDISTEHLLFMKREPINVVLIVITSNRGLCGAFNSNIIKEAHRVIHEKFYKQLRDRKITLICFGKKAVEQLQKHYDILFSNESILDSPHFDEIGKIAADLIDGFCCKKIDEILILHNSFVNSATQKVSIESFLPFAFSKKLSPINNNANYIFEPSQSELVNTLIHRLLKIKLYKTLLDSIAAEHGARMTAMAKATDNATEILRELKLKYNNARQAVITSELNEIESGAEALKN